MANQTYSFADINCTIELPFFPPYNINGQGIGEISIDPLNDNTVHDVASDGQIMPSKVVAQNKSVTISIQQTSELHRRLSGVYNRLISADASYWAAGRINITTRPGGINGDYINLTGVSFTKDKTQPYQQQGQKVTWSFMATQGPTFASPGFAPVTPPANNI